MSNLYITIVNRNMCSNRIIPDSIVVSIPACHAGDPGSIPGQGVFFFVLFLHFLSEVFVLSLTNHMLNNTFQGLVLSILLVICFAWGGGTWSHKPFIIGILEKQTGLIPER